MQDSYFGQADQTRIQSRSTDRPQDPFQHQQSEKDGRNYIWSPTEILNFTMLQWLPGPEAVRNPEYGKLRR